MSVCKSCGVETISYNSCRNRHCPKCQVTNREKWILDRESELLPVPYYHIVFTLPHAFNELLPHYDKEIYTALFAASWLTIQKFATDPKYLGAKTGMVSILHIPMRYAFGTGYGDSNSGSTPMFTVSCQEVELHLQENGNPADIKTNTSFLKEH